MFAGKCVPYVYSISVFINKQKRKWIKTNVFKICINTPNYSNFSKCSQGTRSRIPMAGVRVAICTMVLLFSSFFFFRKNYLLLSCATSVRLSVRPSVRLSSVEIISFRGNSLSNRPIDLKIGLNVREGVVHVRKA